MTNTSNTAEILTIVMSNETFAVPASMVLEILDPGPTTPVPTATAFINKLINFRGRVVPLADLRLRCGLPIGEPSGDARVVVLEIRFEGEPTLVAILADKVYEVGTLEGVIADKVPRIGTRWHPEFIKAIGRHKDKFVMILDIDRIFASSDSVT
ncbi:MAG: chemotaxis protein CheW [Magnetococcales bacterium]|nr:chemotaxis protein CheW [Magnetococcales bacterium]